MKLSFTAGAIVRRVTFGESMTGAPDLEKIVKTDAGPFDLIERTQGRDPAMQFAGIRIARDDDIGEATA